MRPPTDTPIMNRERLRISKVPVKHAETRLISSLPNGRVPLKSCLLLKSEFDTEIVSYYTFVQILSIEVESC